MSKVLGLFLLGVICLTNAAVLFNPPYYSQHDPRWGNNPLGQGPETISQEGCLLTCMASMIAYEGIDVSGNFPDPNTVNQYFLSIGEFSGDIIMFKSPQHLGFTYDGEVTASSDIVNAMNEGKFALLNVLHGSHWVLATGFITGGWSVMDPGNVTNSYQYGDAVKAVIYSPPAGSAISQQQSQPQQSQPQQSQPQQSQPQQSQPQQSQPQQSQPQQSQPQQSTSSSTQGSLSSQALAIHNQYRAALGIPALTWSSLLAQSAQAWANYLAQTGTISHSPNRINIGENLAYGSASTNDVTNLIDLWGSEEQYFVPGQNYPGCSSTGNESSVEHYTQMIWRATTQLGCGMSTANGMIYLVCQYETAGNIDGQPVY